jgi:hypothetical protein
MLFGLQAGLLSVSYGSQAVLAYKVKQSLRQIKVLSQKTPLKMEFFGLKYNMITCQQAYSKLMPQA